MLSSAGAPFAGLFKAAGLGLVHGSLVSSPAQGCNEKICHGPLLDSQQRRDRNEHIRIACGKREEERCARADMVRIDLY
jgi:hypothetical protein